MTTLKCPKCGASPTVVSIKKYLPETAFGTERWIVTCCDKTEHGMDWSRVVEKWSGIEWDDWDWPEDPEASI